jgi:vancomycin permeability regulator SanA
MASGGMLSRALRLGAGLGLLAAGGFVGPNAWAAWSARGRVYQDASNVPARSVAIVPGADVHRGQPLRSLEGRLRTALELYRSHRVKAIVVSGLDTPAQPEVTVMKRWLAAHDVPAADVWADPHGTRTRETMLRAATAFSISDAVICTQASYVDRALLLARAAGIDAVGVGLPSSATRSLRGRAIEALKTTLAVVESTALPATPTQPTQPTIVASR